MQDRLLLRLIQRTRDVIASLAALLLLMPILLVVALAIRLSMGPPALFRQSRAGRDGVQFTFYKFRTMTSERDGVGNPLPDQKRITRLGAFLRRTTIDELPSLFNVLKGDMSLVGPRPLYPEYTQLYSSEQARRLEIKPGLTGWAVVKGRNALSWEERFRLDVWYVDNQSFWLDIQILLMTVAKVLKREGVSADGHATMPRFEGTKESNRGDAA